MRWTARTNRTVCLLVAIVLAWPISYGGATGLLLWASPLLFLALLSAGDAVSLWSVLGAAALIMIVWRPRWYCRWVCPTGCLCDMVSGKRRRMSWLPPLGAGVAGAVLLASLIGVSVLSMFDPNVIFHAFFAGLRRQPVGPSLLAPVGLLLVLGLSALMPGIWCHKLCPLGGLQDAVTWVKKRVRKEADPPHDFRPARRLALGGLAGIGLGWVFKQSTAPAESHAVRPPGALAEDEFAAKCLRCGNCIKACPTRIIQPSWNASHLAGLLTPAVSFASGYCLPECTACGRVCPSDAIGPFTKDDKKTLVMGVAHVDRQACLLTELQECDRCRFYCPYQAVSIRMSDIDLVARAEILSDQCVGCGACVAVCPTSAIAVRPPADRQNRSS